MEDILREAGLDYLFDEVGIDVLSLIADEELEKRREKGQRMWLEDDPDRGAPRNLKRGPSCIDRLIVDYEAT